MSWANAACVAEGVADAAGEERVAGEQVRVAGRVVVQQGDRAGRVAGERDHLERAVADGDGVAVAAPRGSTGTPVCSVIASASGAPATTVGAGGGDDVGEGAVVVPVLVGGDDRGEPGVADQRRAAARARRRRR